MKTRSYPRYTYCLIFCLQAVAHSAEIPKLFNNIALNLGGAWDGGVAPGSGDVMLWNNLFTDHLTAGSLSPLGGDMTVQGIKITNVGGTANPGGRYVGYSNAGSTNTLTIGAGGIDASAATQAFYGQSRIALSASQTWNVANANTAGSPAGFNNGEDIAFQAQAAAIPFNLGGHTLTTTGTGQITFSSGYTLSNGTIDSGNNFFTIQGGSSRVTTIENSVNLIVSAGTLRIQGNSGSGGVSMVSAAPVTVNGGIFSIRNNTAGLSTTQSGAITLNAGSGLSYQVDTSGPSTTSGNIAVNGDTTWRVAGGGSPADGVAVTGNLSGSGNITYLNTATVPAGGVIRLAGDNSGYSGTISLNGGSGNRSLRLGSATAGSAAATWNVGTDNILEVHGVSAELGALHGGGTVTNSSSAAPATIQIGSGLFTGSISDGLTQSTALTKTGAGTLVLTGLNTYTGITHINGGTLVTTPDQLGFGDFVVADGAAFGTLVTLSDTTLVAGDVTVGSATGATLQIDFGSQPNPSFAPLSAGNLLFNGTSTIKVIGKNLTVGTFPVVQYVTLDAGSTPVSGLNLELATRTNGTLADTGTGQINVTITDTEQVKWDGDVSSDWDIDPDGSGSDGTPNWLTTVTNADTRYIQGPDGTDVVTFDDSATGSGTVNLTAALSPVGLTVDNTTKDYTFTGSGHLTGFTSLEKNGSGTLTIANTTANDYTGGTLVNEGTLRLGDGVTAGAGVIAGNIENEGTLVINRPDDHDFANTLTGLGTLEKAQASTLNFPGAVTLDNPLAVTGGKVRFAAGGLVNGVISGSGEIEAAGGTLDLGGFDPNTHTGMTTVSAGALRLAKPPGVDAVGGDITITGTGALNILADEQIPDTATIRVLGSNADSISGTPGFETFANAIVNGSVPATQLIMRSGMTITGTGTVQQGILGVASGNTANVNAVVLTSPTAIARIAANTAPSTMNVGTGGITASAGTFEVKFNTNNQDGILNLSGDVTTTGDFTFTTTGYDGPNLHVIRLVGSRTFDIGAATVTTVAADFGDYVDELFNVIPGTLVKTGAGTLVLTNISDANHTGGTTVAAGTLQMDGELSGTVQVDAAGTLGGSGTLSGATTVEGTVSPGASVGQLTSTSSLTLAPGSAYDVEIGSWTGVTPGTDWDHLSVNALALTATPADKLTLRILGAPAGFSESAKTLVIATSTQAIAGFDTDAIEIDATGFSGSGTWEVELTGNTLELVYTAGAMSAYDTWALAEGLDESNNAKSDDPDEDGQSNLVEFALNGSPQSGAASGKMVGKIATVGAEQALTLTLPVRNGAVFSGATEQTATVDGTVYRIQGGNDLASWNLGVGEVTGGDATAIQAGLPSLSAGWTYRTFRSPGPVSGDPKEFLRALIEEEIVIAP